MRKQDVKAGMAYAWQRSDNYSPEPCVLLSTDLHTRRRRGERGTPWCRPASGTRVTRAGRGWGGGDTGYPALLRKQTFGTAGDGLTDAKLVALMLSVTPDCLATGEVPGSLKLEILTSLTALRGPWDEVKSAYDAEARLASEQREREAAERKSETERAGRVSSAFAAHGVSVLYRDFQGYPVGMSLDDAEKLAALLSKITEV